MWTPKWRPSGFQRLRTDSERVRWHPSPKWAPPERKTPSQRPIPTFASDNSFSALVLLDEVFREMGKLDSRRWDDWRRGRVPYLERMIRLNLSQINVVCRAVQASAGQGNLKPSWTAYVKWGKGPRTPLRFTKSGDPHLERVWATRHVRTQPRSAEVNATATSATDTHGQVANASGADLETGFTPTSTSESAPVPAMP